MKYRPTETNRDTQKRWNNQHVDIKRIAREALTEMGDEKEVKNSNEEADKSYSD